MITVGMGKRSQFHFFLHKIHSICGMKNYTICIESQNITKNCAVKYVNTFITDTRMTYDNFYTNERSMHDIYEA